MRSHEGEAILLLGSRDAVVSPSEVDGIPVQVVTTAEIAAARPWIETGNYRVATPAIEAFYALVERCLRYRITGALIYGPSRIGKTRSIEYLRLLLSEAHPRATTYHAQAEHKPRHAEGAFFATCSRP